MILQSLLSRFGDVEFLEAINVWLLWFEVGSAFSCAIGIAYETVDLGKRAQHHAVWVVVVAAFAEAVFAVLLFVSDGQISKLQRDQIVALETRLAPRTLSAAALNRIAMKLKPFDGVAFDVAIDPVVEVDFMFAVMGSIASANWKRIPFPGSNSVFPNGVGFIVTHPGLQIRIDESRHDKFGAAAIALSDAFSREGFSAPLIFEYPGSEVSPDAIHVEIGRKP